MRRLLTQEEAIDQAGAAAVAAVERENCEPTNTVGYNGACQEDALTEWSASVSFTDEDGVIRRLVAYYYTTNEEDEAIAAYDGDGSVIDWEIAGYEIS